MKPKVQVHPNAIAEGDAAIIVPDETGQEWLVYGVNLALQAEDQEIDSIPAYVVESLNQFETIDAFIEGLRREEVSFTNGRMTMDREEKVLAWPTNYDDRLAATRVAIRELVDRGLVRHAGLDPDGRIRWEATPEDEIGGHREAVIKIHPRALPDGEPTVVPTEDGTLVLVAGAEEARRYLDEDHETIPLTFILTKRTERGGDTEPITSPEEAIALLREAPDRIVNHAVIHNQEEAKQFLSEATDPALRDWTKWYREATDQNADMVRLDGTKVVDTFTLIHLINDTRERGHKRQFPEDLIPKLDPAGNHLVLARPAWEPTIVVEDGRDEEGKGRILNDMTLGTPMPCLVMCKTKGVDGAVEAELDVTLMLYSGLESIQEEDGRAVNSPADGKLRVSLGEDGQTVVLDGEIRNARLMRLIEDGMDPDEALRRTIIAGVKVMKLREKHGMMPRQHYTCAKPDCHLRLNRAQDLDADGNPIEGAIRWMHSRGIADLDHKPDPVREEDCPAIIVCDFCLAFNPRQLIGCRGMDPEDLEFLDCWACCDDCLAFIDGGRWDDLTARSLQSHMEVGQGTQIKPHERNAYLMAQRARLENVHRRIAEHYEGHVWVMEDVRAGVAGP